MSKAWRFVISGALFVIGSLVSAQSSSIPEITNLDEIAKALKVDQFKGRQFTRKIRVAVLDNGFSGYEGEIGKSLPQNTIYHAGKASAADDRENVSIHGLFMAQILSGLIQKSESVADYELHLFDAFGYTKFADAAEAVTKEKFDVVLYSQVWEYAGNGDGQGFINALVTKAVDSGVIWINAAGNFGRLTKIAPVVSQSDGTNEWVVFESNGENVTVTCQAPENEQCSLRLTLAWNDFKNDPETGTDKDLDLFLYDSKDNLVASSERNQKLAADANDKMSSILPRELIETKVSSGTYTVTVKNKSKNFSAAHDQLRLTLSGPYLTLSNPSVGETLLPPADHPGVIVIGASDDPQTNTSKNLNKPDINLKSLVTLKDGSKPFSTSNAAAMAAAVVTLQLGTGAESKREALVDALLPLSQKLPELQNSGDGANNRDGNNRGSNNRGSNNRGGGESAGASEPFEDSFDRQANCLRPIPNSELYDEARRLLVRGEVELVNLRGRVSVAVYGPLSQYFDVSNLDDDQRLFVTPKGLRILGPEDWANGLHRSVLEVHSTRVPFCRSGELGWMK